MEVDKEILTKLLEAFVDTASVLQEELMLYQLLFQGACKAEGLTPRQTQLALERARQTQGPRIHQVNLAAHRDLVAKIPQIVDLLGSDQAQAWTFLKGWIPKGPPN